MKSHVNLSEADYYDIVAVIKTWLVAKMDGVGTDKQCLLSQLDFAAGAEAQLRALLNQLCADADYSDLLRRLLQGGNVE